MFSLFKLQGNCGPSVNCFFSLLISGAHGANGAHSGAVGSDRAKERCWRRLGQGAAVFACDDSLGPTLREQRQHVHLELRDPVGQQQVFLIGHLQENKNHKCYNYISLSHMFVNYFPRKIKPRVYVKHK